MIKNEYVERYIDLYETGKIKLNKERIMLIEYLKEHVLSRDDLYFDDKHIEQCIQYIEKWYFPLKEFQKFVRSEEHTSELQSRFDLVCRLLLEKKKKYKYICT